MVDIPVKWQMYSYNVGVHNKLTADSIYLLSEKHLGFIYVKVCYVLCSLVEKWIFHFLLLEEFAVFKLHLPKNSILMCSL